VVLKYKAPSVPDGAVANWPNLRTPSIIRFPAFVCAVEDTFIGAGRLELILPDEFHILCIYY